MLKGIDPLLNADLLCTVRAMGHGDDLVLADANFPVDDAGQAADAHGRHRPARASQAVLSVCRSTISCPTRPLRIEVVDKPDEVPPVCDDYPEIHERAEGSGANSASSNASPSTSAPGRPSPCARRRDPPLWLRAAEKGHRPPGLIHRLQRGFSEIDSADPASPAQLEARHELPAQSLAAADLPPSTHQKLS